MNEVDIISEQVQHDYQTTASIVDDTTDLMATYSPRLAEPIVIRGAGHITVFALNNRFDEEYPAGLTHKVSRDEFRETIKRVNTILRKNVSNNFKWLLCGCICCCCTIGLSFCPVLYLNHRSQNAIKQILDAENSRLYHKIGYHWHLARQKCPNNANFLRRSIVASTNVRQTVVKSIISGDTLIIKPDNQRISLTNIDAPKLARSPTELDEPYAFECREFLRKKCVGKNIFYSVDFEIPESHRLMCSVYLGDDFETSENLTESLLGQGLVKLRQQNGVRAKDPKYRKLFEISKKAKENQVGIYSNDSPRKHIRDIKWTLTNPKDFFHRQTFLKPMDAIVELIRDGNTFRCLLLPSYNFATIQLTGIRCPMLKHEGNNVSIDNDEPFAQEAKDFVEYRLLQCDVKILLSEVKNQNLLGTILYPAGNISYFLLREGLAKCVDQTMTLLPQNWREQYRSAEKFAKDHRLRIWQNYKPRTTNEIHRDNYQAKVLEIVYADALIVRDLRNDQIQKVYLSSVRAPRAADFALTQNRSTSAKIYAVKRPLYDIPFLWEGHEFLREKLIGQTVCIRTDYILKATDEHPEKICCSVYLGNVNMAAALISKGLAKAQRHRQNDEQRSSHYDSLLAAEQQAMKHNFGLFSGGTGLRQTIDLTDENNREETKNLFKFFKRNGRMNGIVNCVISGSRFRIHLLRENYIISLCLSSLQCPRPERHLADAETVEPAEPFGTEALNFSKEHFLQRDVIVEVEVVDRLGNFIGRLTTADGQSAALMLVQTGLAKLNGSSAHLAPNYEELYKAQERCKRQRMGVWTTNEEPNDEINANRVVITYISSDLKVYVQYSNQGKQIEQLQSNLRQHFTETKPTGRYSPKQNELVAARFSSDDQWYRARVEKVESNYRISVYYIDYGNREVITNTKRLTALPRDLTQLPGQAYEYELANVSIPTVSNAREKVRETLLNIVGNDECLIKMEYQLNNVEYVSLINVITGDNLLKSLIEENPIVLTES